MGSSGYKAIIHARYKTLLKRVSALLNEDSKPGSEDPIHRKSEAEDLKEYPRWVDDVESIDADLAWHQFRERIGNPGNRSAIRILKYAAVVFFMIALGGVVFNYSINNLKTAQSVQSQVIPPGSKKAVLILDDGKTMNLDTGDEFTISEHDGSLIEKKRSRLDYKPVSKEGKQLIYNEVHIPRGGEFELFLSDGTRVVLNSMSVLKYPVAFGSKERAVELTGEAYFEVEGDPRRPFRVNTGELNIDVLGTRFNVNAYKESDRVTTTLVEGKVTLHTGDTEGQQWVLSPEEQMTFRSGQNQASIRKVNTDLYTSWTKGQFRFKNERLEDIMTILARWYIIDVHFDQEELKDIRFSGSLNRYDDIGEILEIIETAEDITIAIEQETVHFTSDTKPKRMKKKEAH